MVVYLRSIVILNWSYDYMVELKLNKFFSLSVVLAVLHLPHYVLGKKLNKLRLTFFINVLRRF